MKVLFISSGNSHLGISPIVSRQGKSLENLVESVCYFTIQGKGLIGYIKNIVRLRLFLKNNKFDIIHAHYSLSAIVASLAGAKNLVVSLMGSDVKSSSKIVYIIKFFNYVHWSKVIVKSLDMKFSSGLNDAIVVPNGVDFDQFKPLKKSMCIEKVGWDLKKKHVLFAANPERREKNFELVLHAFNALKSNEELELHTLNNVNSQDMVYYFNAADVVLLSSLWEGSPNVVKEAMACNRPFVSTNVGDVEILFSDTDGYYLSSFEENEYRKQIIEALSFSTEFDNTQGRDRIQALNLDAANVAEKLISIYNLVINEKRK